MTQFQEQARVIAKGLSPAQRKYLLAVGASEAPYTPRHGVTANWALRHGYVDTIVRLGDGREGAWKDFHAGDRIEIGIDELLGQRLTLLGAAVRAILQEQNDAR